MHLGRVKAWSLAHASDTLMPMMVPNSAVFRTTAVNEATASSDGSFFFLAKTPSRESRPSRNAMGFLPDPPMARFCDIITGNGILEMHLASQGISASLRRPDEPRSASSGQQHVVPPSLPSAPLPPPRAHGASEMGNWMQALFRNGKCKRNFAQLAMSNAHREDGWP